MKKLNLKSYALWASVLSLVALVLGNYGLFDVIKMDKETFFEIGFAILGILGMAGIIKNNQKEGK